MERRTFSKYEQETIRIIVNNAKVSPSYMLSSAYNDIFMGTNVVFTDNKLCFYFKDTYAYDNEEETLHEVENDVIVKTLLLKYLTNSGYIYLIADKNVKNFSSDIDFADHINTNREVQLNLPRDISTFIKNSKKRIVVSAELISLVDNDFKTYEDKQLEKASEQLESSEKSLSSSLENVNIAKKLVKAAQDQLEEVKIQTKTLQSQLDETKRQTIEARNQTIRAQEQTDEAKKQRIASWSAVGISTIALIASSVIPFVITRCNKEKEKNVAVTTTMDSIKSVFIPTSEILRQDIDSICVYTNTMLKQKDSIIILQNQLKKEIRSARKSIKSNNNK